jgi:hypothetical protein
MVDPGLLYSHNGDGMGFLDASRGQAGERPLHSAIVRAGACRGALVRRRLGSSGGARVRDGCALWAYGGEPRRHRRGFAPS